MDKEKGREELVRENKLLKRLVAELRGEVTKLRNELEQLKQAYKVRYSYTQG